MKKIFEEIYLKKSWLNTHGTESGPGSSIEYSKPYVDYLSLFIELNRVATILDLGCGDFNLMKHISFKNKNYLGVDIVDHVIENNNKIYASECIKFVCESILEFTSNQSFDLVLCKDVFQHYCIGDRFKLIKNINIQDYKYCIITNDYNKTNNNNEIVTGDYIPIDLTQSPYNIQGTYVFGWDCFQSMKKSLLLHK